MGQLTNLYVSQSYQGLLKMTDSTNGLTGTLQTVQTGDGDNSPLQMSLTEVNISGSFYINNVPISSSAGSSGTSGTSGVAGSSGTSGTSGLAGSSGTSGTSGSSGSSGTSGADGLVGSNGTSGTSGTSGQNGSSGTSGTSGGTGSSGTSGTSGVGGSSGTSGTSGVSGSSGTSGTSGGTGSSGTSGTSGADGISSPFAQTGSFWNTTNNIGITGSLNANGNVLINGSLIGNTDNNGLIKIYSQGFTSGAISPISASAPVSQSNLIFGGATGPAGAGFTGSIVISGSNNILLNGSRTVGTVGTYGMVNSNNVITFIPTVQTGSYPNTTISNNFGNGSISTFFTTGSQNPPVVSGNILGGATVTLRHNSGSIAMSQNVILGTVNSFASQSFLSSSLNNPIVQQNYINGVVNLLHTSSSIVLQQNNINANGVNIRNEFSSSFSPATNQILVQRNSIIGNNIQLLVSGSPSSGESRLITDNLLGGLNSNVTSSYSGSNNAHLHGTIVFGSGLVVSASNPANTGGSTFVGRFNATGSNQESSNDAVFVVGSGTSTSTRRNALHIDNSSNVRITGSLNASGSNHQIVGNTIITGSIASSDRTFVIFSGSMRMSNESGSIRIADSTNQPQLFFNPTRKVGFFLGQSNMDQTDTQFGITSDSTDNYVIGGNFNNFRSGSNNLMLGIGNISIKSGSNNVILAKQSSYTTGSNNLILGSGPSGIDEVQNYFNVQLPSNTVPIMFKSGSAPLNISGSLEIASGSGTNDLFMYGHKMFNVGQFQQNSTLSGSANVSQSITYDVTDVSYGVSLVAGSRITYANAGVYSTTFSAQLLADAGADNVYIWLKKNGTNVPESATKLPLTNNEAALMTVNFVTEVAANDYLEIAWQSTNGDAVIYSETASGNVPAVPAIITSTVQVR